MPNSQEVFGSRACCRDARTRPCSSMTGVAPGIFNVGKRGELALPLETRQIQIPRA